MKRKQLEFKRREAGALLLALSVGAGILVGRLLPSWEQSQAQPIHHPGILVHHSASPARLGGDLVGAEHIARWHEGDQFRLEWGDELYHIAYHYVIRADGVIEAGRPLGAPGGHTSDPRMNTYVGICLIGDFSEPSDAGGVQTPSPAQRDALVRLISLLKGRYRFSLDDVHAHHEVSATACPGDGVDLPAILGRIEARLASR